MATISISNVVCKQLNITCYAGDTFRRVLTFTDGNGDPIDLSTSTLKMQVRQLFLNKTSVVVLTFQEGDNSITKAVNVVTLKKDIAIKGGDYVYDFQVTDADDVVTTYLNGSFKVIQDVTDAI